MQLLRATSGSVVLMRTRAVLISKALVTTKIHVDARGLGCHLKPCYCPCVQESWPRALLAHSGDGDAGSGLGEEELATTFLPSVDDFRHGGKQSDSSSLRGLATRNLTMLSKYVNNTKWTFFPLGGGHGEGVGMGRLGVVSVIRVHDVRFLNNQLKII